MIGLEVERLVHVRPYKRFRVDGLGRGSANSSEQACISLLASLDIPRYLQV